MLATAMVLLCLVKKIKDVMLSVQLYLIRTVKNIVKLVIRRKMFTKKAACKVGFDIFVVRWMKPNCIALPVPSA